MNVRMMGPLDVAAQTVTVHGRAYTAGPGVIRTVPAHDGAALEVQGWTRIAASGPTTSRPDAGQFWDETLHQLIIFDGATWRDPATGAAL